MSTALPGTHITFDGFCEIASHHVGKTLIKSIADNLLMGGTIRRAEYYMGRSRSLLQHFFAHLPLEDQENIRDQFLSTTEIKERLESGKDSGFRKYLLARDYKRESKAMFKIIQVASQRSVDGNLMDQILGGGRGGGGGVPPQPPDGTTTVPQASNPFTDPHVASTLASINVHNLDSIELETYRSPTTGDAAIVLGLHNRDGTTQEVAGTIPFAAISGERSDERVETATISSVDSQRL